MVDCDTINVKRGELYLKLIELDLAGTTGEVEDPKFILNSILMSTDQFEEKMDILKIASTVRFDSLTNYSKLEVESWLVICVNKRKVIEDTLRQISRECRDLKSTLFDIKLRQEITAAPMRDYIENWLKNALTKIMELYQEEVVATGHEIPMKEIRKGTSASR